MCKKLFFPEDNYKLNAVALPFIDRVDRVSLFGQTGLFQLSSLVLSCNDRNNINYIGLNSWIKKINIFIYMI